MNAARAAIAWAALLALAACGERGGDAGAAARPGPDVARALAPADTKLLAAAERLLAQGRAADAYGKLAPLLEWNPPHVQAQELAGIAAVRLDRYGEAAERLQDAVDRDPALWPRMVQLGLVYQMLGELDRADLTFAAVLQRAPAKAKAWSGRAAVAFDRGDLTATRNYLEQALALDPANQRARFLRAQLLDQEQRPAEALAEVDAVLAERPSHERALYLRALLLDRLGRKAEAEAALARRADVYRLQERVASLVNQISAGKGDASTHAKIVRAYQEMEDRAEARRACALALVQFPGDAALSALAGELGGVDEAGAPALED